MKIVKDEPSDFESDKTLAVWRVGGKTIKIEAVELLKALELKLGDRDADSIIVYGKEVRNY